MILPLTTHHHAVYVTGYALPSSYETNRFGNKVVETAISISKCSFGWGRSLNPSYIGRFRNLHFLERLSSVALI
ncbi:MULTISPECIES: hypothetical protein, partial [unclassified Moorena]